MRGRQKRNSSARAAGSRGAARGVPAGSPGARSESILGSSAYAFATQVAAAGFTAALTLYLVRALGPSRYGDFALAVGVGGLIALPADFGISSSTARFVAEHRGERARIAELLADAIRLKLVLSSVACGTLAALAGPIAAAYHAPLVWPLRAVALAVFGQNMMFLFEGAFIAAGRVAANVRFVFAEGAIETSASFALVLAGGGAAGAAWGRAIGYCFGGGMALVLGARAFGWPAALRRRSRDSSRRRIFRYAVPLILVDGANALFGMIDLLLIGAYLGSARVGLFSAPLRLLTLLSYPGYAVASGVAPRMARGQGREPNAAALAGALRGLLLFNSLLLAPLVIWARPIVHLLLGGSYVGSTSTVRVLSIAVYLGGLAPLVSLSANYLGDANRRVPLMITSALMNGVIDVVLIPRIGIVAGAVGTACALSFMVVGHLLICLRHVELPLGSLALSAARGLLAAAAMAGVLRVMGTDPGAALLLLGGIAGIAVFGLTLLIVRELTSGELGQARRWATGKLASRP